jgi:hypothetical protein
MDQPKEVASEISCDSITLAPPRQIAMPTAKRSSARCHRKESALLAIIVFLEAAIVGFMLVAVCFVMTYRILGKPRRIIQ